MKTKIRTQEPEAHRGYKQCDINVVMRWLGFSGHKWKYHSIIYKECKKCGIRCRLIDYDGFYETWQKV